MILLSRVLVKAASSLIPCLLASAAWGASPAGVTVEETYPGLAEGVLREARLETLPRGVVIQAGEIQIDQEFIRKIIQKVEPELRSHYEKNLFFILEREVVREIILHEARRAGVKQASPDDEAIQEYLDKKIPGVEVTRQEMEEFYRQNKEAFGGIPFEDVKDDLQAYLSEQKRNEAIRSYERSVGVGRDILVDAKWSERQYMLSKDNPVDKARLSGKPSMVEFGAPGCGPCELMQPILENLRKKHRDRLNIVFLDVGKEPIVGSRYGITAIPVQAFFDKEGREVFRHTGFYPQAEVEKKLAEMGVL